MDIVRQIANELHLSVPQVNSVLELFNDGATVPFIARYRKEQTGGCDEDVLRQIEDRFEYITLLLNRKETILKSIEEQGKLTPELKVKIEEVLKLRELEDIYLPYKPKRKTRGTIARSKGLEPLALFILENSTFNGNFDEVLSQYVSEENSVKDEKEALQGAKDIIAEMISENAEVRKSLREFLFENSIMISAINENLDKSTLKGKNDVYEIYHEFRVDLQKLKPHQVLALNRGERNGFLKLNLSFEEKRVFNLIYKNAFIFECSTFDEIIKTTIQDSFKRLLFPSIERELRNKLTEEASEHAISVFSTNVQQLFLQPPILEKIIMGIDPGFVSGSKIAVIDRTGKYIEGCTIYPHPPQNKTIASEKIILEYIEKYDVQLIAIGNGTASRETELLIANLIKKHNLDCKYMIVSEAGASVYSASSVAKQEFPELEASQRGNISIARRVLDPLAELVKIDPKSIGVGLYQHDVDQKMLSKKLNEVVESCVNYVGVDVNTASVSLLTHVSGLNSSAARKIVKYRELNGEFSTRNELMNVPGFGDKTFEQAAGFLKIRKSINHLDNTFIHPESYDATNKLLKLCHISSENISSQTNALDLKISNVGIENIAHQINIGIPTLEDIIENLKKPGRDPRSDLPKPVLREDVLSIEDLNENMMIKGTVRNVVDFGAFVDIGLKSDALLHISEMSNRFVKDPSTIVSVGDIIDVRVKNVNMSTGKVALSLKTL